MNSVAKAKLIAVLGPGLLVLALLLLHFFTSFYVPQSSDARDQQLPQINSLIQAKLYDEQAVLTQLEQLNAAQNTTQAGLADEAAPTVPDRFDSWHSDGQWIALMAIYQQQQATALLWLKTKAAATPELVRLQQGEQHQGVSVIELTSTTATLQLNQQQRTLRLFTPGEKLKQQNSQDSGN